MDEGTWDNLKSACSNNSPAGENCEYEPAFLELMSLASPRPEVQMGATVIAARLHDWPAILEQSLSLSQRTRDLRVGVLLAESMAQVHGWSGLAEGCEILWCWTTQLWSNIFPELDCEDNYDPTARLSALAHLLSDQFIQRTLYQLPLAEHATLGTLRLRDTVTIHKGKKEVARELSPAEIEAFFMETEALPLAVRLRNLDRCCTAVEAIDQFLNSRPGTDGWSASRLLDMLHRSRDVLFKHLSQHQLLDPSSMLDEAMLNSSGDSESLMSVPGEMPGMESMHGLDCSAPHSATLAYAVPTSQAVVSPNQNNQNKLDPVRICLAATSPVALPGPMQIRSRQDVTAAIDAMCDYFRTHEPASPVPLLLQRAKRLTSMNFIELMHELAPNEAMQLLRQLHVVEKAG